MQSQIQTETILLKSASGDNDQHQRERTICRESSEILFSIRSAIKKRDNKASLTSIIEMILTLLTCTIPFVHLQYLYLFYTHFVNTKIEAQKEKKCGYNELVIITFNAYSRREFHLALLYFFFFFWLKWNRLDWSTLH